MNAFEHHLIEQRKARETEFLRIIEKYEKTTIKSDIIDLETMTVIKDYGHLPGVKFKEMGFMTKYRISKQAEKNIDNIFETMEKGEVAHYFEARSSSISRNTFNAITGSSTGPGAMIHQSAPTFGESQKLDESLYPLLTRMDPEFSDASAAEESLSDISDESSTEDSDTIMNTFVKTSLSIKYYKSSSCMPHMLGTKKQRISKDSASRNSFNVQSIPRCVLGQFRTPKSKGQSSWIRPPRPKKPRKSEVSYLRLRDAYPSIYENVALDDLSLFVRDKPTL